jgi:hypothetical protein
VLVHSARHCAEHFNSEALHEDAYFESDEELLMFDEVGGNETPARVCPPADDSDDEDYNSDWGCS